MKVAYSDAALDKIANIAEFVDDINTSGACERWLDRIFDFIEDYANVRHVEWPLCRNKNLAALSDSRLIYKNWVIAFRIEEKTFRVYDFIQGSLLE